jgi:threonyl-tRNA synthetase
MIHRALFGSMERFIGIMLEHYAGALPLWLSPVQVKVIPISDKYLEYARQVLDECRAAGIRAEIDDRAEKMGYKIRDAEIKKIPYMAIVGEKEQEAKTVSARRHKGGDQGATSLASFVEGVVSEAKKMS